MVKKEELPPENIEAQVGNLLNARREATGVYKASLRNLIDSIDKLFKTDDALLSLFIRPKPE